jgi:hypothetical protein
MKNEKLRLWYPITLFLFLHLYLYYFLATYVMLSFLFTPPRYHVVCPVQPVQYVVASMTKHEDKQQSYLLFIGTMPFLFFSFLCFSSSIEQSLLQQSQQQFFVVVLLMQLDY